MVPRLAAHSGRVCPATMIGCVVLLAFASPLVARGRRAARAGGAAVEPGGIRFKVSSVYVETRTEYHGERTVRFGRRARDLDRVLTFRDTAIEERFGLGVSGDVYHSELFAYRADFVFGGRHEWFFRKFLTSGRKDYEAGPILEYDIRTDILQNKPVAASLLARQIERFIPREFRLSQRETITDLGGEVRYQSRVLPMRLSLHRFTSDVDGVEQEVVAQERDEKTVNYELDWRPSRRQRFSLDYEYLDRVTEQPAGGTRTVENLEQWHDLDIFHDLRWGPHEKYELQTRFELRDEAGTAPQDRVRFNPRLRTRHTPQLETLVQYLLDEQQLAGARNLLQRVDLGFTRQIYESLTIDGNIFGEADDLPHATRGWLAGGDLSMAYRKKSPWGQWQGQFSTNYTTRQIDGLKTTAPVVRESAAFRGAVPARLDHDDIVISSIQVRSLDGAKTYRRDRDYRILAVGRKTSLVRMIGSDIGNGEVTQVSYLRVVPAESRLDNTTANLEIAHLFDNGLRPYYRFGVREEEITVRNLTPPLEEDITDHTLGFQWDWRRFILEGEYDIHNSSLFPEEGYRVSLDVRLLRRPGMNLTWTGVSSDRRFRGFLPRDTKRFETGLIYDQELTKTMRLSASARYANENESIDKRTEGFTLDTRLKWEVRDVTIELSIEHSDLRDRWQDEADTRIWLEMRRTFIR